MDAQGFLLEGSIATLAVLLTNGEFVVPKFERIIPGTTAVKIFNYIERELIPQGILSTVKSIVRRDITIKEAQEESLEVMFLGGEECVPVIEWDGYTIGDGVRGPAAKLFSEHLGKYSKEQTLISGQIKVDYSS